MSVRIHLPSQIILVDCYKQLNLLGHAQLEEIDLGSQCGGHGICGKDRVQILEGVDRLSPVTSAEERHLSKSEIQNGVRLACQAWPEGDLCTIELSRASEAPPPR
jgi:ferredoxin